MDSRPRNLAEAHERHTIEELLRQEKYTPDELADLLGMSVDRIHQAVFHHELRAEVVGHNVVCIRRDDALAWLRAQA